MRRVLCTITAYPPSTGGAQIYTHALLTHLTGTEAEVVSCWDDNRSDWLLGTTVFAPSPRDYRIDGVAVHRLGATLGERVRAVPAVACYYGPTRWAARRLARPLYAKLAPRARRADVVHAVRVGREPLAMAAADAAKSAGRPFVLTPLHHPRWSGPRHRVYVDLYRRADHLIALTEAERRTLIELGVRPERVSVTGIGPVLAATGDGGAFRRRHGLAGPVVLFLGQHFRYKGWRTVLAAATRVWARQPDTRFVFAGPTVGRSERAFRHTDPRVLRLGRVDLQTKTDALAACDVLCVPSTQESFGGVFTEAWVLGRPVIGGDTPAVREVIDDGIDGFVVNQDADQVAERVLAVVSDPSGAARMGAAGRTKVAERYSWPALAAKTERIYAALG
jgi:glycosyltransferase involved in cell wall biosynthesis